MATGNGQLPPLRIRVQEEDFSVAEVERWLDRGDGGSGAVVGFTGYVRGEGGAGGTRALWLEHYPGMTERALADIAGEASRRWELRAVAVLHRVGQLAVGARIVHVGVASAHRADAFAACEFIMDYLKTRAPFWKKELTGQGGRWVERRASDDAAAQRWSAAAPAARPNNEEGVV